MIDFPEESVTRAREIAGRYRQRTRSKKETAALLYDGKFFEIRYGFSEAVRSGNCGKYLHEMTTETDCFAMAGALFLIAREAGLKPKIYLASKMRDHNEGVDSGESAGADHTFVTVRVGRGKECLIDPFMTKFGLLTFHPDNHRMEIYNRKLRSRVQREYAAIRELPLQEYLRRLQHSRTPQGGREALATTKRVTGAGGRVVFVTHLPETHEIRSSLHLLLSRFGPEPYDRSQVIDLVTGVGEDGSFDFRDGTLSMYYASALGWEEHRNSQVPITCKMRDVVRLGQIWEAIAKTAGRKTQACRMFPFGILELSRKSGFNDTFRVERGSAAARAVTKGYGRETA